MYDTVKGVREYCIKNQKPYLIECLTFRMRGHEEASGVKYVTFSTVHQPTTTGDQFELFDKNSPTPKVLPDANGKSYCAIILQCNIDTGLPDAAGENDPPVSDGGVEKGPIPFAKPKPIKKKPPPKKSAKKSVKKVSKKAAKKTGKGK